MKLDAFSENLLQLVKEEYRISDLTLDRFRRLARNGLCVEQILLASGLLNQKQYQSLLEIASGLPLAPHAIEALALDDFSGEDMRTYRAMPFKQKNAQVHVAFSRPEPSHILSVRNIFSGKDLRVIPYVIAEVVLKRNIRTEPKKRTHAIVAALISSLESQGFAHARLLEDASGVHVLTDTYHPVEGISLSSDELPACVLFLKRKKSELGWKISEEHHGLTRALHLSNERSGAHPLDWLGSPDDILQGEGLTVVIRPDASLQPAVNGIPAFTHFSDWNKNQRRYSTDTPREKEMALHAALAGERVLALSGEGDEWWSDAAFAGIPVTVLKSHVTPKGRAWEVYTS